VLHFIGTNLPNGVSFTGKSVYIAGARYSGTFGVGSDTGAFTFTDNRLQTTSTNEEIIIEPAGTGYVAIDTNSGLIIPVGTTGQRPSAQTGMIRFNSTDGQVEVYNGSSWQGVGSTNSVTLDEFDGDGSTTGFTLSRTGTAASVWVAINGVTQEVTNTYTVSGTTLTFNEAPASGDKIQVRNFYSSNSVTVSTSIIQDADNDTKIQAEESADEDVIRFDTGGTERLTISSTGQIVVTTGYTPGSDYALATKKYVDDNAGGGSLSNIVEDTTPQLGGNLDAQSNNITSLGTVNTHTIPGGTGTFALTSDITLSTLSVTATASELNYVDGVTSNIQTQLDAKASLSGATFTGNVIFDTGVEEAFDTLTGSTGTVTHNCDNGHVFYHTGASGDITANFTNLGLTAEYGTNVTVIINQGATPYEVTAVQIGGVVQTINWQGGSAPTGNANGIDSFSFTILNDGGTYVVLGQMVDFT